MFTKPLWQTVWTQIRLLLLEQSVLGPRCLLLYLIRSNARQLFAADDFSRQHFQMHFYVISTKISWAGPISDILNMKQTAFVSCLYRTALDVMQHSVASYLDLCLVG